MAQADRLISLAACAAGLLATSTFNSDIASAAPVYHDGNGGTPIEEPYPLPDRSCYIKESNGVYKFQIEGLLKKDETAFLYVKVTDEDISWYRNETQQGQRYPRNQDGVEVKNPLGTPLEYFVSPDGTTQRVPPRIKWILTRNNMCTKYNDDGEDSYHLSAERLKEDQESYRLTANTLSSYSYTLGFSQSYGGAKLPEKPRVQGALGTLQQ